MPSWYYFARPNNLAFHDLRDNKSIHLPNYTKSLLGLGLKFCPTPRLTSSLITINTTLSRHQQDLWIKNFYNNQTLDNTNYNPKLHVKSKWTPPEFAIAPELKRRFATFRPAYKKLMRVHKGKSNLLPHHRRALQFLQQSKELIVVPCDKNLGPACINIQHYIKLAYRDHLNDPSTYRLLNEDEVQSTTSRIRDILKKWIIKWKQQLRSDEKKFINAAVRDPTAEGISTMYLTMKVHKSPLKTRPIVSCSGTLLHSLGIWVDSKLQRISQKQQSYFKSSTELKREIVNIQLPSDCLLFTADAVSMYTNINTDKAIAVIATYLHANEQLFPEVPVDALIEALRIIMTNNIFRFGDTTWHQLEGTAMGTPPAPPYATLFYAIHEDTLLLEFGSELVYYKRFIDDIFGIWRINNRTTDPEVWSSFKQRLNEFQLEWEVGTRSDCIDFMDLTI